MTHAKDTISQVRETIGNFPDSSGLYFMKDSSGIVLYIGKAKNLRSRAMSYFQPAADIATTRGPKILEMLKKVATVDYLQTDSEVDAILQEARLIKDIRPPYNTDLVDDKTFPYLEIRSKQDFPGVYLTRTPEPNSKLFGPFTSAYELRGAIVLLQKIFKFRTCKLDIDSNDEKRRFFRPCILYSIKQCTAPCANKVDKQHYRQQVKDLIKFLNSKRTIIIKQWQKQMEDASNNLEFEKAGMLRDRIRVVERLSNRGTVDGNVQPEAFAFDAAGALVELQKILKSDQPIRIIEGIDIAHIQGTDTVGSLVKFIDGKPFKTGYRRFKIKTVSGIDDYGSISEVISRRYKQALQGQELWPDLILIDGGKGQLSSAAKAFQQLNAPETRIISLAKKFEEIYTLDSNKPIKLPANNPARKLLQFVRDESHRFAQHYHHILRTKTTLNSK